jgi:hypothetical protein
MVNYRCKVDKTPAWHRVEHHHKNSNMGLIFRIDV